MSRGTYSEQLAKRERELRSVMGRFDRIEIEIGDALYPEQLLRLDEPPAKLYAIGDIDALRGPCVAVTGTRRPTEYGEEASKLAAEAAAERGAVIVTGGAIGCEATAAAEALARGARHVAVLGCGADVPYPASNYDLFAKTIETGGAVVSPYPWGQQPRRHAFAARWKVAAGLSDCLVVTEAGVPSGTFHAAMEAMDARRDVLVVPGPIFSPRSQGANELIAEGFRCVPSPADMRRLISESLRSECRGDVGLDELAIECSYARGSGVPPERSDGTR